MKKQNTNYIQTYTGKAFWFPYPTQEMLCLEDIAHSLSNLCRFAGHCKEFYSVAQHAVLVSYAVQTILSKQKAYVTPLEHLLLQFEGLHHDDEEAYIIDLPAPIKGLPILKQYKILGKRITTLLRNWLNLPKEESNYVKEADLIILATEKRDLMFDNGLKWQKLLTPLDIVIQALSPIDAKKLYLERHYYLLNQIEKFT